MSNMSHLVTQSWLLILIQVQWNVEYEPFSYTVEFGHVPSIHATLTHMLPVVLAIILLGAGDLLRKQEIS